MKSVVAAATALVVEGCSSDDSTAVEGANGGRQGGPGGQQFTAVNLNTDGASPGGANTADVAAAATAFLATLTDSQKAKVVYEFADHQARQTWSNYPAFAVPRSGMEMSELTTAQQAAVDAMMQAALGESGRLQDADIRTADDYLHNLGGSGADGFGALTDYYVAVYGAPSTRAARAPPTSTTTRSTATRPTTTAAASRASVVSR